MSMTFVTVFDSGRNPASPSKVRPFVPASWCPGDAGVYWAKGHVTGQKTTFTHQTQKRI